MEHLDTGTIALSALGESIDDVARARHLRECGHCQQELSRMAATVSVARSTLGERALQAPPAHVWTNIHRELGLAPELASPAMASAQDPVSATSAARDDAHPIAAAPVASAPATGAPVASMADARARRSGMRRFVAPIAASAAAAAIVAGAVLGWDAIAPQAQQTVLATAQLDALPAWAGSAGEATVITTDGGDRTVRITLDASTPDDVVQEVWLLTPEVDGLISLGLLTGSTGEFAVPASIDLAEFSVVDISAEPLDGDPAHSGDSIVRGALDS